MRPLPRPGTGRRRQIWIFGPERELTRPVRARDPAAMHDEHTHPLKERIETNDPGPRKRLTTRRPPQAQRLGSGQGSGGDGPGRGWRGRPVMGQGGGARAATPQAPGREHVQQPDEGRSGSGGEADLR
ncbi:hypothetical protein Aab01nite_70070 [Paractinoplanes abujensis]|nr:hypothetical protein Aab01nite_70070 [Actinoplanes abujensis]